MPHIKLVTFDLDNTLWSVETVIGNADRRMRAWLHERVPDFTARFPAEAVVDLRDAVLAETPELRHDLSKLREELLYRAIVQCGFHGREARLLAREAFGVFLEARHEVEFFEGALETLETLSRTYLLGALTNGNADIRRLKLDRFFHFGYSSASIGVGKPAPDIFHAALRRAGAEPREAVHVGDHLEDDIQGASAVGMHTIWLNLDGEAAAPDAAAATRTVRSIEEVPDTVEQLERNLNPQGSLT